MASEQGTVSSAVVSEYPPALTDSATVSPRPTEPTRAKSLKRGRTIDTWPKSNFSGNSSFDFSPNTKSPRLHVTFNPPVLTGAVAMEDNRRSQMQNNAVNSAPGMSENPVHRAVSSLMAGGGAEMSRPQDVSATSQMSEGMAIAANALTIPAQQYRGERMNTGPASVTSLANLSTTAPTATASPTIFASPGAIGGLPDSGSRIGSFGSLGSLRATAEESNRALSFPGHVLAQQELARGPQRGSSLPMPGQNPQLAPKSPSQKKHKCPYCDTEFTRHHNLKSHLLTHSHEKPYVCQTCNMRFRRLHDLKRHTKLHTGERPHVCPKCDRKFARGDALARHSKGQGGCAGRRASMGSFGGEDEYQGSNPGDDEDMDGVSYTNGTSRAGPESEVTEEERRRASLPVINAQHVAQKDSQDRYGSHSRASSTYPPARPKQQPPPPPQLSGGLYPPNIDRGSSSSAISPSMQNSYSNPSQGGSSLSSMAVSTGPGSVYAQSAMTESPKPLSPAGMQTHQLGHDPSSMSRQRSPSLATQFQQNFGRRGTGGRDSPNISLPSPHDRSQHPKLPALAGLAPPENRLPLNNQMQMQQNPNLGQQGPFSANSPSSMFLPQRPNVPSIQGGSGDSSKNLFALGENSKNLFAAGEQGVWAYVQTLEDQVKDLTSKVQGSQTREAAAQDQIQRQEREIKNLTEQANYLRSQLGLYNQGQQPAGSGQT
ncbi:hypothetical protein BJ878DRAFT_476930 [Calycina marina]|uniref:C2H2-type domain-containing protein n=1 Tax=Calycina marina TaxID=1763456 RepID=A0A9P7Z9R5_9HELO|nr:hypothetical protein BJ878DRAFT_476930 [Calycina marina]